MNRTSNDKVFYFLFRGYWKHNNITSLFAKELHYKCLYIKVFMKNVFVFTRRSRYQFEVSKNIKLKLEMAN